MCVLSSFITYYIFICLQYGRFGWYSSWEEKISMISLLLEHWSIYLQFFSCCHCLTAAERGSWWTPRSHILISSYLQWFCNYQEVWCFLGVLWTLQWLQLSGRFATCQSVNPLSKFWLDLSSCVSLTMLSLMKRVRQSIAVISTVCKANFCPPFHSWKLIAFHRR